MSQSLGDPDDCAWYNSVAMYYDGGHNLRLGLFDRWKARADGSPDPASYEKLAALEFRVDPVLGGPRACYADADCANPGADPSAGGTRYEYAGGYGYESGLLVLAGSNPRLSPVTLQHLGQRWYQPDVGRFVQRDPIGSGGGVNVYEYVSSDPAELVDPEGLEAIGIGPNPLDIPIRNWPNLLKLPVTPRLILDTPAETVAPYLSACVFAAEVGYHGGKALDSFVKRKTGRSISDRLGDWLARTCESCWGWVWW